MEKRFEVIKFDGCTESVIQDFDSFEEALNAKESEYFKDNSNRFTYFIKVVISFVL
jgi:hypothetical protein